MSLPTAPTVFEYLPWGHDWQAERLVAPVADENFPAGQSWHTDEASVSAYLPSTQFWQLLCDVAPTTVENLPEGQLRHTFGVIAPVVAEYFPTGQD